MEKFKVNGTAGFAVSCALACASLLMANYYGFVEGFKAKQRIDMATINKFGNDVCDILNNYKK